MAVKQFRVCSLKKQKTNLVEPQLPLAPLTAAAMPMRYLAHIQQDGVSDRVAGQNGTYLLHHFNAVRRSSLLLLPVKRWRQENRKGCHGASTGRQSTAMLCFSFVSSSNHIERHWRIRQMSGASEDKLSEDPMESEVFKSEE